MSAREYGWHPPVYGFFWVEDSFGRRCCCLGRDGTVRVVWHSRRQVAR